MSKLTLQLFGAPPVALDQANLHIQRRKAVALLAYLAVTQAPHRRDALATLFWPDFDQTGARDNLRRTLSSLHQALHHDWLEIDRTTVRLPARPDLWVDVAHFRHLLAHCQSHPHPTDQLCDDCLAHLNDAVQLYAGDLLAGFTLADSPGFDDWQAFETERLRIAFAGVLARLTERGGLSCSRRNVHNEPAKAEQFLRRALAVCQKSGDPSAGGYTCQNLGWVCVELGKYGEAKPFLDQAILIFEELGNTLGLGITLFRAGQLATALGDYAGAIQIYRQAMSYCDEAQSALHASFCRIDLGIAFRLQGDYRQAEQISRETLDTFKAMNSRRHEGYCLLNLGCLAQDQGDLGYFLLLYTRQAETVGVKQNSKL